MKCPFCNEEIEENSSVCPICGKTMTAEGVQEIAEGTVESVEETTETVKAAAETEVHDITVEAETAAKELEVVPATKKNNKKTLGIAAVIAVVGVVAVGAAVMMPKKNPKDVVINAFKSISAEGQTNPMDELFGWKAMDEKLSKEASEINLEIQLQDSSDETVKMLSTGKLGMTVFNDPVNKKASGALGVGYADMNIANFEFYLDDKQVVAAIPELSKKAFSINYAEDLEGQLERSPFFGQMLSESGTDLTGLNNYLAKWNELASSDRQFFDVKSLWNRYKEGSKAIEDLKAAMTVAEKDKKSFTIDGKEESCQGYDVTITKDALIQFMTTTKEFFLSDETLKKDFVDYTSLMTEIQSTMVYMYADTEKTPEELQAETWTDAAEQADRLIEQMKESMGDVTLVVYARKDGKMASFDYKTSVTVDEETLQVYGTVTFGGGYSMMANVKADVNMEDADGQKITLLADKTGTYEAGKSLAGALTLTASSDMDDRSEAFNIVLNGDYTAESGTYNLSATVQANGAEMGKASSTGMIQNLVKGESFELIIDSAKVETDMLSYDGTSQYIDFSGLYRAAPLASTIEIPAGESFDVLAATETDYNAVYDEIVGNVYTIIMDVSSMVN